MDLSFCLYEEEKCVSMGFFQPWYDKDGTKRISYICQIDKAGKNGRKKGGYRKKVKR